MISLELLEELVTFKKYGTLSATAKHLMLTQPSVTRGMKKLEQELGTELFTRKANRLILNETGEFTAKEAEKLLQENKNFVTKVINFSKRHQSINVASEAPGPLLLLVQQINNLPVINFQQQLITANMIFAKLHSYQDQLIFTTQEYDTAEVESLYLGQEKLAIRLDKMNPLSQKKQVTFHDLANLSFLAIQDIGPWTNIIKDNVPHAQLLYQKDLNALNQLTHYSSFPVFISNITLATGYKANPDDNRIIVPIEDEHNYIDIFGTYLKSQRTIVRPILRAIAKNWPK